MSGMANDSDDPVFRRLFAELRQRDRAWTPAFDTLLSSARSRAAKARARRPLLAAAAVAVLVAGIALTVLVLRRRDPRVPLEALAGWKSPTAFLLEMHGVTYLDSVPSVTASLVNPEALRDGRPPSSIQ